MHGLSAWHTCLLRQPCSGGTRPQVLHVVHMLYTCQRFPPVTSALWGGGRESERLHGMASTRACISLVVTERCGRVQLAGTVMTQSVMSQNLMLHNQLQERSRPSATAVRSLACSCALLLLLGPMRLIALAPRGRAARRELE